MATTPIILRSFPHTGVHLGFYGACPGALSEAALASAAATDESEPEQRVTRKRTRQHHTRAGGVPSSPLR